MSRARPALLVAGARVLVGQGGEGQAAREIVRRAGTEERVIVRLEGVEDRSAAEALRGLALRVPRAAAPPLEDDEFWAEDLEGCVVRDGALRVGVVRRLLAYPSCELLEVERDDEAGDLLVPLVRDAVRDVDVDARVVEVDLRFLGLAGGPDGAPGHGAVRDRGGAPGQAGFPDQGGA